MPLGMIQKLLDDKWIWIIFHHRRDENRVMMPGKDLDINWGITLENVLRWILHKTASIHCEILRGKFGRYHVRTDWKWLTASTLATTERWQKIRKSILNDWGSVKQRLIGNIDHLETSVENDLLNLLATETMLRICNLIEKTVVLDALCYWTSEYVEQNLSQTGETDLISCAVSLVRGKNWSFLIFAKANYY